MGNLETLTGGMARHILTQNKISSERFHIALLQLRIREQEGELRLDYTRVKL